MYPRGGRQQGSWGGHLSGIGPTGPRSIRGGRTHPFKVLPALCLAAGESNDLSPWSMFLPPPHPLLAARARQENVAIFLPFRVVRCETVQLFLLCIFHSAVTINDGDGLLRLLIGRARSKGVSREGEGKGKVGSSHVGLSNVEHSFCR